MMNCALRLTRTSLRRLSTGVRVKQAEAVTIPAADGSPPEYSIKINKLVDEISKMTLLEVSELTSALKTRLNLPDAPVIMGGVAPAAAKADDDEDEAAPKAVQTSFTVKLMKFDEKQKVALIKECKNLLEGMNLVQAKKFVESAPVVVKADIGKDEADKLKEALSKVGAELVIE